MWQVWVWGLKFSPRHFFILIRLHIISEANQSERRYRSQQIGRFEKDAEQPRSASKSD